MLDDHSISPPASRRLRSTNWWICTSSSRHSCTPSRAPVISSICDSLKSVVMCGCVSAEPSARGCGVSARLPEGSTRRPSFSMPRRMPLSRSGPGTAMDACDVFILVYRFVDGHRPTRKPPGFPADPTRTPNDRETAGNAMAPVRLTTRFGLLPRMGSPRAKGICQSFALPAGAALIPGKGRPASGEISGQPLVIDGLQPWPCPLPACPGRRRWRAPVRRCGPAPGPVARPAVPAPARPGQGKRLRSA
ncbi:MAG: hypothetical protein GAK34_02562 [Delftia tsuruhatensis]|nr:MAG: hypothetical protein GAK34_02562 [Delftia tsuruhatensis]